MEMPGAPMLVSQQSNPQPVSACFAASTSGSSRSEGRESSRSPLKQLPACLEEVCPNREKGGLSKHTGLAWLCVRRDFPLSLLSPRQLMVLIPPSPQGVTEASVG